MSQYSDQTVEQYAAYQYDVKLRGDIKNAAFEELMWNNRAAVRGPNNLHPWTIAQFESVLGITENHRGSLRDACCGVRIFSKGGDVKRRVLTPGCCLFDQKESRDDTCPGCGESRYVDSTADVLVKLNQSMYVFSIESGMDQKFCDPRWVAARDNATRDGDFYASEYGVSANVQLGGRLTSKSNGSFTSVIVEGGQDDANMKHRSKTNTGLFVARFLDIPLSNTCGPGSNRGSSFNFVPILLRPACLKDDENGAPPLGPYLSDFRRSMSIYANPATPYVAPNGRKYSVFWLLAQADGPAAAAIAGTRGGVAYWRSWYNFFQGVHLGKGNGGMRYKGYCKPQDQTALLGSNPLYAVRHVNYRGSLVPEIYPTTQSNPSAIYVRDAQQATHDLINAAGQTASRLRVRLATKAEISRVPLVQNISMFTDLSGEPLPGVQLDKAMPMGLYHFLAYGVFKDLMEQYFPKVIANPAPPYVVSAAARTAMDETAHLIRYPSGCSRPYKAAHRYFRGWTMEEAVLFITGPACVVLKDAHTGPHAEEYYKLVTLLSSACRDLFNARATLEETKRGTETLLQYAVLAEKLHDDGLLAPKGEIFTGNLSVLVSQLDRQHIKTGAPASTNELWIERAIRWLLGCARRGSTNLEAFVVNEMLRQQRVRAVLAKYPKQAERTKRNTGKRDDVGTDGDNFFSSEGKQRGANWSRFDDLVAEIIAFSAATNGDDSDAHAALIDGLQPGALHPVVLTEYQTMHHSSGKEVAAATYRRRQKKRVSYHIAIGYEETVLPPALPEDVMREMEEDCADARKPGGKGSGAGRGKDYMGTRVAKLFEEEGGRKQWYSGVVGRFNSSKGVWGVLFWDGERIKLKPAEVPAHIRNYERHGQAALAAMHATAVAAAAAAPKSITSTEYARVDRFFKVEVQGQEPLRLALVSVFKTKTVMSPTLAYATVDTREVMGDSDVMLRVINVDAIEGVVILVPPALLAGGVEEPGLSSVVPFVKN